MRQVMMISNQETKTLTALEHKKYRESLGLFRAEGSKVIAPLLQFFRPRLIAVPEGTKTHLDAGIPEEIVRHVPIAQYRRLSLLESPSDMIAVLHKPSDKPTLSGNMSGIVVALDSIQNPGNLGTIIRLCDWLGIRTLLLGEGCVDPYNPKVIQATAGALGALTIHEQVDLTTFLPTLTCPIIGTALDGVEVGQFQCFDGDAVILFGNEGHGMSDTLKQCCTHLIRIPSAQTTVSESLNVSISAAIILSHITLS